MNFGEWVRQKRGNLGLEVFSEYLGVDKSTISRIETQAAQATLYTAVLICDGLGVTVPQLMSELRGEQRMTLLEPDLLRDTEVVLSITDIERFIKFFLKDTSGCCFWMADALNAVGFATTEDRALYIDLEEKIFVSASNWVMSREMHDAAQASFRAVPAVFSPMDVYKMIFRSYTYDVNLVYPSAEREVLLNIYRQGGILLPYEVGNYIKMLRREEQVTLSHLKNLVRVSDSILSRIENGIVEQMKLIDVILLIEALGNKGEILGMYWNVCILRDRISRYQRINNQGKVRTNDIMYRLVNTFIKLVRWLDQKSEDGTLWLDQLRSQMQKVAIEK